MVLMVMGIVSLGYGLKGERVPGRVLSITDTKSNSLGAAQRTTFVAVGLCAIVLGFLDLYRQYKRAEASSRGQPTQALPLELSGNMRTARVRGNYAMGRVRGRV